MFGVFLIRFNVCVDRDFLKRNCITGHKTAVLKAKLYKLYV